MWILWTWRCWSKTCEKKGRPTSLISDTMAMSQSHLTSNPWSHYFSTWPYVRSRACSETRDVSMEYKKYQSGDRYRINEKDECIWKWNWWRRWMHLYGSWLVYMSHVISSWPDEKPWSRGIWPPELTPRLGPGIHVTRYKVPWCYLILSKDQKL